MSHAHASTRASLTLTRRLLLDSPFRHTRLCRIALCIVAAMLLSSCERAAAPDTASQRKDAAEAAQASNNAPPPVLKAETTNSSQPIAATAQYDRMVVGDGRREAGSDDKEFNTEAYKHIDENPFLEVARAALHLLDRRGHGFLQQHAPIPP